MNTDPTMEKHGRGGEALAILGLECCDSPAQLKAAYRRQMRVWHPDRFPHDQCARMTATQRAQKINEAHDQLLRLLELGHGPVIRRRGPGGGPRNQAPAEKSGRDFTAEFSRPGVAEVRLDSSHILSAAYDRATATLYLKFKDGSVYAYFQVPGAVYRDLVNAGSPGRFARQFIFGEYATQRGCR